LAIDISPHSNAYLFGDGRSVQRKEWLFLFPAAGLSVLGIMLLSGSEPDYLSGLRLWHKQTIWTLFGVGVALTVSRIPIRFLVRLAIPFYLLNLSILVGIFWVGTQKGGATSWLHLGYFTFQPSELTKLATILILARVLVPDKDNDPGLPNLLKAIVYAAIPAVLIAAQPDLGTAMIFAPILLAALYGSRLPRKYILILLSPLWALVALPNQFLPWIIWGSGVGLWLAIQAFSGESGRRLFMYAATQLVVVLIVLNTTHFLWNSVLKDHQKGRLVGFVDAGETVSTRDLRGSQYHLRQSLIAIASGGLIGQGLGEGMQSSHGFIPMMRTDFIFAMLAEEGGFASSILLLSLFALLLVQTSRAAAIADTWAENTVVFGILGMWAGHVFINIGMTMGLVPITGIPLPFVSYGGSSVLTNFIALGLALSVLRRGRWQEDLSV